LDCAAGNRELLESIRERIRAEGGQRALNLKGEKHTHGTWWNWRPEKMALEHLYSFGDLMIAGRVNFQRIYDLTERVLPKWGGPDRTDRRKSATASGWTRRKSPGHRLPAQCRRLHLDEAGQGPPA